MVSALKTPGGITDKTDNADGEADAKMPPERTLEEIKAENKATQLKLKLLKQVDVLKSDTINLF